MGNACGISDEQDYSESDRPFNMRQRQQVYQGKGRKQSKISEKENPCFFIFISSFSESHSKLPLITVISYIITY